jgi:hypothetical protein
MSISAAEVDLRVKESSSCLMLFPPPHPAYMQHPVPRLTNSLPERVDGEKHILLCEAQVRW